MESSLENSTNEIGFFLKLAPLCLAEKKTYQVWSLSQTQLGFGCFAEPTSLWSELVAIHAKYSFGGRSRDPWLHLGVLFHCWRHPHLEEKRGFWLDMNCLWFDFIWFFFQYHSFITMPFNQTGLWIFLEIKDIWLFCKIRERDEAISYEELICASLFGSFFSSCLCTSSNEGLEGVSSMAMDDYC